MTEEATGMTAGAGGGVQAPPADDENPAIIEAHKTFVITMIGSALFIGSVLVFIL